MAQFGVTFSMAASMLFNCSGARYLLMMRAPRKECRERKFSAILVDREGGNIHFYTIPPLVKIKYFYNNKIAIERTAPNYKSVSKIIKSCIGNKGKVLISAPFTSILYDIIKLRESLPTNTFIIGGSGIFDSFAKYLGSKYKNTIIVQGPGFGNSELDTRIKALVDSPIKYLEKGTVNLIKKMPKSSAIIELITETEKCPARLIPEKILKRQGKLKGYKYIKKAYQTTGNLTLAPYLGENLNEKAFRAYVKFLSQIEFLEGDISRKGEFPSLYLYWSYGCPNACEYCSAPVLRRGHSSLSEKTKAELIRKIRKIFNERRKIRIGLMDENINIDEFIDFLNNVIKHIIKPSKKKKGFMQIEISDGFYPQKFMTGINEIKKVINNLKTRAKKKGIKILIGAYFPAENWGFAEVQFYQHKKATYELLLKREETLKKILKLFDYISTSIGISFGLQNREFFMRYVVKHVLPLWQRVFIKVTNNNAILTPYNYQIFPNSALGELSFNLFDQSFRQGIFHTANKKKLLTLVEAYAFGENFASPAFIAKNAGDFLVLLKVFKEIWTLANGEKSWKYMEKYGMTARPPIATNKF